MTPSDEQPALGPLGFSDSVASSIGERLQKARLEKGTLIPELSRKIKVREHFLSAIEAGDHSELPRGLNGRGLIRLYARDLGVSIPELDPTSHLTETNARVEREEQVHGQKGFARAHN